MGRGGGDTVWEVRVVIVIVKSGGADGDPFIRPAISFVGQKLPVDHVKDISRVSVDKDVAVPPGK